MKTLIDNVDVRNFMDGLVGKIGSFKIVDQINGASLIFGPHGTIMIIVDNVTGQHGFLVSVNGYANYSVHLALQLVKKFPCMGHFGPFSESVNGSDDIYMDEVGIISNQMAFTINRAKQFASLLEKEEMSSLIIHEEKRIIH